MVQANVIHAAFTHGVKKLLFLGSSCIYPRLAPQPMAEDALLTGPLEPTNEPYSIAKIAGSKLCESYSRQYGAGNDIDFCSVIPTNLYGPGDNYHPEVLGWAPEIIAHQTCQEMVASDQQEAKRHALLKANGYRVQVSSEWRC